MPTLANVITNKLNQNGWDPKAAAKSRLNPLIRLHARVNLCKIKPAGSQARHILHAQTDGMRFADTEEVIGSIPIPPTILSTN
jgi:hypothetical protein